MGNPRSLILGHRVKDRGLPAHAGDVHCRASVHIGATRQEQFGGFLVLILGRYMQ